MSLTIRHTIAVEGRPTEDGRELLEGALQWMPDVPVLIFYQQVEPLASSASGMAGHFQREPGGLITAELDFFDGREPPRGVPLAIAITVDGIGIDDPFDEEAAPLLQLKRARLRQVSLQPSENAVWPECVLTIPREY